MIEIFLIALVIFMELFFYFNSLWEKHRWKKSGKGKEAAHVLALADQIYIRKNYDRSIFSSLENTTIGYKTRGRRKGQALPRSSGQYSTNGRG